jgi:rhomboid protease GluP
MKKLEDIIKALNQVTIPTRCLPVCNLLILVNIVVYIIEVANPDIVQMFLFRSNIPYSYITSLFLHADVSHLMGNLLILSLVVRTIERNYGSLFTFLAYIFTGIVGSMFFAFFLPEALALGASGSVCGLLMLWVLHTLLNRQFLLPIAALFYLAMQGIMSGMTLVIPTNIGYLAHYGAVFGAILLLPHLYMVRRKRIK